MEEEKPSDTLNRIRELLAETERIQNENEFLCVAHMLSVRSWGNDDLAPLKMLSDISGRVEREEISKLVTEPKTLCDSCHLNPIRFKCLDCTDFALCKDCESSDFLHFDGKHNFKKVEQPREGGCTLY